VIDLNCCHTWWIRPSHDFMNLWGWREVPRKVLEMPKRPCMKGESIKWPRLHLQLYKLRGNPFFWGTNPLWQKILLFSRQGGGEKLLHTPTPSPRKRDKGLSHIAGGLPPLCPSPLSSPLHQVAPLHQHLPQATDLCNISLLWVVLHVSEGIGWTGWDFSTRKKVIDG
jgi:hypothetical protein